MTIDDDNDIRSALRALGDRPTDRFRSDLASLLADEAGGALQLRARRPSEHTRRGWTLALAAAAVVAVVTGIVIATAPGGDGTLVPGTVPPTTESTESTERATAIAEQQALTREALLRATAGRRWVAIEAAGPLLPSVGLEPTRLDGFDGCEPYGGPLVLDGDVIASVQYPAPVAGCPSGDQYVPMGGNRLVVTPGGALQVLDTVTGPRATYVDLGALPTVADPSDLTGTWLVGDVTVEFTADGTLHVLNCEQPWQLTAGRVTLDDPQGAATCPLTGVTDAELPAVRLWDMASGGFTARVDGDTVLADDGDVVIRLTRSIADALAGAIAGRTWVLTDEGDPYPSVRRPTLEFPPGEYAGGVLLNGDDGCNRYALTNASFAFETRTIDLTSAQVESTTVDCGDRPTVLVGGGDRIELDQDATRLTVTSASGVVHTFTALDSYAVADASDISGTWLLDGGPIASIDVTGGTGDGSGGHLVIGSCDVAWSIDGGRVTTTGWPADPSSCLAGATDETSGRLVEALRSGVTASTTDGDLVLANASFVVRLQAPPTATP